MAQSQDRIDGLTQDFTNGLTQYVQQWQQSNNQVLEGMSDDDQAEIIANGYFNSMASLSPIHAEAAQIAKQRVRSRRTAKSPATATVNR